MLGIHLFTRDASVNKRGLRRQKGWATALTQRTIFFFLFPTSSITTHSDWLTGCVCYTKQRQRGETHQQALVRTATSYFADFNICCSDDNIRGRMLKVCQLTRSLVDPQQLQLSGPRQTFSFFFRMKNLQTETAPLFGIIFPLSHLLKTSSNQRILDYAIQGSFTFALPVGLRWWPRC